MRVTRRTRTECRRHAVSGVLPMYSVLLGSLLSLAQLPVNDVTHVQQYCQHARRVQTCRVSYVMSASLEDPFPYHCNTRVQ